jgi:hypothetical protein
MDRVINWDLISNPLNWVMVGLMLAIATFGLNLLLSNKGGAIFSTGSAGL